MKKLFLFLAIVFFFSGFSVNQVMAVVQPPVLNSVTALSSCAVRLNWNWQQGGGDQADYFEINRSPTENGAGVVVQRLNNINFLNFENVSLSPETLYWYKVRAGSADFGNSSFSNKRNATTLALPDGRNLPTPVLVNNGNSSFGFDNDNRPALNWRLDNTPQNFNLYGGFRIQKSESAEGVNYGNLSNFDQALPFTPDNGVYSYLGQSFVGADLDKNYKFVVKTLMSGGELCNDNPDHIVPSDGLLEIIVPRRPEISQPRLSGQVFVLSWQKHNDSNDNAIYFELWRKANADPYRLIETIDNPNGESFTDQNILSGNRYFYKIRTCRNNYCSAFSEEISQSYGLPAVSDLKAGFAGERRNGEAQIVLSWQRENFSGDVYVFERSLWNGRFGDFEEIDRVSVDDFDDPDNNDIVNAGLYYDASADLQDYYRYRVKVLNDGQESLYSNNADINLIGLRPFSGWAWSENLGWIRLGKYDPGNPNDNYGVYINQAGQLMGYGWSANAGWLSFNYGDLNDCPDGVCGSPRSGDGRISGWAKFLAADPYQGSWTGWLHLGGGGLDAGDGGEEEERGGAGIGLNSFFGNIIKSFSVLLIK